MMSELENTNWTPCDGGAWGENISGGPGVIVPNLNLVYFRGTG